jgi:hypothetical protein
VNIKRLGASAAALALLATAGCGSGGAATAPELTKANFAAEVSQAQVKAETAHVDAKIGAQGQNMSMTGDMDMSKKDVAFDFTMSGAALGNGAQFILVDKVIYLKVPQLTQSEKYVKVDTADGSDPMAKMFTQMLSQMNPSRTFEAFDAITKLQDKGTQEIDGVETTHYAVTVDTKKALEAQGLAGKVPTGQLPKTLKYDVWVDADKLVRKLTMDVAGSTIDMTLSEWGEPVQISAPPASQTTTMEKLMGQMGGAAAG